MPSMLTRLALLAALLAPPAFPSARPAGAPPATLHYQSPVARALYVLPPTTLAWRLDDALDPDTLNPALFTITGAASGLHPGATHVALDGRTAIFDPNVNFSAGEIVTVTIAEGLATQGGAVWAGTTYTFSISTVGTALSAAANAASLAAEMAAANPAAQPAQTTGSRTVDPADYVTLPAAMPTYTVAGTLSNTITDTYALGLLPFGVPNPELWPGHLLLLDSRGEPLFYQTMPNGSNTVDFKRQPGQRLSYWNALDTQFHVLDHTYTEIDSYSAGNGYLTDIHDFQLLPNGEALLMSYDFQTVDLSQIAPGGHADAAVAGLIIQSIDAADDVVFQWRSWDHFLITDTTIPLNTALVDYVHGNAIEVDDDGNLLISSRHLDEITKLNRDTAAVMWRWGGPNNEFTMDPAAVFYHQHDVRRQADGTVTLFDNHNAGPASRGLTFELDEVNKIATLMNADHHTPEVYGFAMGSYNTWPDGSRLVGWGTGATTMTEFAPDDSVRLDVTLGPNYFSYRAARFPWVAAPAWPPTLVLTDTLPAAAGWVAGTGPALYFSWNGATEVGSYEVYAGYGPEPATLLTTVPRTGFEDHVLIADLVNAPGHACAYRVRALDHAGQPLEFSNTVYASQPCLTSPLWLPLLLQAAPAALSR